MARLRAFALRVAHSFYPLVKRLGITRPIDEKVAGLRAERDAHKVEIVRLIAERDAVKAERAQLVTELAGFEGVKKQQLSKLEGENEQLRSQLDQAETKLADLEATAKLAEREVSSGESAKSRALALLQANTPDAVEQAIAILTETERRDRLSALSARLSAPDSERQRLLDDEMRFQRGFTLDHALARNVNAAAGVLLVNDTRTQNNVGCRSTTTSLLRAFSDTAAAPASTVTLAELSQAAALLERNAGPPTTYNLDEHLHWFARADEFAMYRAMLESSTAVIINGEGSLYGRQAKGFVLCVLALHARRELNRPVVFTNLTADLQNPTMRLWVEEAFAASSGVWLREPRSLLEIQDADALAQVHVAADAAWAESALSPRPLSEWQWAGVFPDELLWRSPTPPYAVVTGTSNVRRPDREPSDPWAATTALCHALRAQGIEPVLYAADEHDGPFLRPIATWLRTPYVSAATPVPVVRSLFAEAAVTVSGRWHASILSCGVGTPVILGDANTFKTDALQELMEFPWPMFNYRELQESTDGLLEAVKAAIAAGEAERSRLLERAREQRDLFFESANSIAGQLASEMSHAEPAQ